MTTNLTAPRKIDDTFIGRTADGLRLFVTLELRQDPRPGEATSTEHEAIPRPLTLSVMGGTVDRRHDFESCGQILEEGRTARPDPMSFWTQADIDSLLAIWERWHLNTMQAGCAHQPPESVVYETTRGYRSPDLENTPRCPETGYKWGSNWLAEVVPDDVLVEFHRLMDLPLGPAPAWLR